MSRIKQVHLDIIDSQEADEDGIIYATPTSVPSPALEVENAPLIDPLCSK